MKNDELKPGQLLCSKPYIGDMNFEKSVVLITKYSKDEGAEGLVLNQPISVDNIEDLGEIGQFTNEFYLGGPVDRDHLFYLHNIPQLLPGSERIMDDLYFGGSATDLIDLIQIGSVPKSAIRFFVGISGWYPGQLENELIENVWFVVSPFAKQSILEWKYNNLWEKIVSSMGEPYSLYLNGPSNPEFN